MSTAFKYLFLFSFLCQTGLAANLKEFRDGENTPLPGAATTMKKEDCNRVDLSMKMGPVRNQVGASCYAYTATDIINFDRTPTFSALHLAQTNIQESTGDFEFSGLDLTGIKGLNGGLLSDAIEFGLQNGMCPEKEIPSIDKDNGLKILYGDILKKYHDASEAGCKELELVKLESIYGLSRELEQKVGLWNRLKSAVKLSYPGFNMTKLESIYKEMAPENFFWAIAEEACKGKLVKVKDKKVTNLNIAEEGKDGRWYFDADARPALLDHINKSLNKGKPVGITYESGGLIQPPGSNQTHISPIAGRLWSDTAPVGCYFLVKNSWGSDWKVPNGFKGRNVAGKPGYFMISEQSLMEHVHATTSLD